MAARGHTRSDALRGGQPLFQVSGLGLTNGSFAWAQYQKGRRSSVVVSPAGDVNPNHVWGDRRVSQCSGHHCLSLHISSDSWGAQCPGGLE